MHQALGNQAPLGIGGHAHLRAVHDDVAERTLALEQRLVFDIEHAHGHPAGFGKKARTFFGCPEVGTAAIHHAHMGSTLERSLHEHGRPGTAGTQNQNALALHFERVLAAILPKAPTVGIIAEGHPVADCHGIDCADQTRSIGKLVHVLHDGLLERHGHVVACKAHFLERRGYGRQGFQRDIEGKVDSVDAQAGKRGVMDLGGLGVRHRAADYGEQLGLTADGDHAFH